MGNQKCPQTEVYDNGSVLKYDLSHLDDEHGMIADVSLDTRELEESETEFITLEEFEAAWNGSRALNRHN